MLDAGGKRTGVRADEVNAVEWENRVRNDLGMQERNKYGGVNVHGMGISESDKYPGYFNLVNKSEYASAIGKPASLNIAAKREGLGNYYSGGIRIDGGLKKPIPKTQVRIYHF